MNARRLQGLALILSAACLLIGLLITNSSFAPAIAILGILLFMVGIPAVHSMQPTGWLGLTGIVLLELAALIALLFRLDLVPSGAGGSLSLASAILGMLGAIIVGWLTTREHVFPAWLGWLFIVYGLLNFAGGLISFGSMAGAISILIGLLDIVVLAGYGYFIYQKR
jgi:hypothetical protein